MTYLTKLNGPRVDQISYDKERDCYRVSTIGGYVETKTLEAAKRIARAYYLASVQNGFMPANFRRGGTA